MDKITKDMMICDNLELQPHTEEIFLAHGMNCLGCPGGSLETVADAAEAHGVSLAVLLEELNK